MNIKIRWLGKGIGRLGRNGEDKREWQSIVDGLGKCGGDYWCIYWHILLPPYVSTNFSALYQNGTQNGCPTLLPYIPIYEPTHPYTQNKLNLINIFKYFFLFYIYFLRKDQFFYLTQSIPNGPMIHTRNLFRQISEKTSSV